MISPGTDTFCKCPFENVRGERKRGNRLFAKVSLIFLLKELKGIPGRAKGLRRERTNINFNISKE